MLAPLERPTLPGKIRGTALRSQRWLYRCGLVLMALATSGAATDGTSTHRARIQAIETADQQLGPRTSEIARTIFWVIHPTAELRDIVAEGRIPTFAESGGALAASIDHDGYFLTAAHAVRDGVHLLGRFENLLELRPATVVFRGNEKNPGDDICILRVNARLSAVLPLGTLPNAAAAPLYACLRADRQATVLAGRLEKLRVVPPNTRSRGIETNFPLVAGDSGGPVLNEKLELIGVISGERRATWSGRDASAVVACPHPSFVAEILGRDKARSTSAP